MPRLSTATVLPSFGTGRAPTVDDECAASAPPANSTVVAAVAAARRAIRRPAGAVGRGAGWTIRGSFGCVLLGTRRPVGSFLCDVGHGARKSANAQVTDLSSVLAADPDLEEEKRIRWTRSRSWI